MPENWVRTLGGQPASIADLKRVADELLHAAGTTKVWYFDGEMGSGKTTLIKVICEQLGVSESTSSPTFSIINEYQSDKGDTIYHFDFYRLKKETEAYDMGVEEYFESGCYCFVEWPERIPTLHPMHFFKVKISEEANNTRIIEYSLL
ncbi:MAG TPA: tRNA (adenosine(37)-N6)-threonylcarbamoyltransferase complex ATPase subunit type 1 TsaE [Cyclobacteriaceae bacterium]|nr:tRNA (adenosine(37)-N6)-threonylcarbamoyltransferase complex ATPase subunit type 1 TsaE [Cyclobacteriaceae bacterium]HNP07218.1 tRNA (adenosine(37)-N6)-threonylcarbamoyltransferase complex ATPase subunit type 1 TsaE [Cyclobacteriaceae bacterium]HRK54517.1 tRNA (adenosine(37)-N6)-threonylcarbamoyltransferase complex ATPase subunit type 1 TsaE [Cyclobacteriaceae bacterium]